MNEGWDMVQAVLTPTEAGVYLRCTEKAIYEMVRAGQIPYRKLGKRVVLLIKDLDAWLDRLPGVSVEQALRAMNPPEEPMKEVQRPSRPNIPRTMALQG